MKIFGIWILQSCLIVYLKIYDLRIFEIYSISIWLKSKCLLKILPGPRANMILMFVLIQLVVDRKILDPDSVSKLSISGLELELKLKLKSEFLAGKQYHAEIFVLK